MKILLSSAVSIIFLVLPINSPAEQYGTRIYDQGLDGSVRYFDVICPSNDRTSLTYNIESKEVCVIFAKDDNQEVCKTNWDKDEAAKEACK